MTLIKYNIIDKYKHFFEEMYEELLKEKEFNEVIKNKLPLFNKENIGDGGLTLFLCEYIDKKKEQTFK